MISVIVDARASQQELPILLSALTLGAIDGLVRDVALVAAGATPLLDALCEESGAELAASVGGAAARARYERVLLLPSEMRLKAQWIAMIADHLGRGGGDAVVIGEGGRWFRPARFGVLTERARLAALAHADLKGARRGLRRPARLG